MPKPSIRKSARKSPVGRSRTIKSLTYEEAYNALTSAISRERGYPTDRESIEAISEEAERWIEWSKRAPSILAEGLANDPDEIIYQIYKRLRLERGWPERIPQAQAEAFWKAVWKIALREAPVKAKEEQERRNHDLKWWREDIQEKAKSRYWHEASKGTMCDDLISAARAFYQPESGEVVIPLRLKSSEDE